MFAMPYSQELNDIPALIGLSQSPERFGQMICDQFDVLYEDGAYDRPGHVDLLAPVSRTGRPHRSKYFARALAHVTSRQEEYGSPPAGRDRRLVQEELLEEMSAAGHPTGWPISSTFTARMRSLYVAAFSPQTSKRAR